MEIISPSPSEKSTSKEQKQDRHKKSDVKQTLSLSSSVTEVREFNVPGVSCTYHMSLDKSGRLWSSGGGNLVHTDLQGNQLQKIQTSGGDSGYHTVTQDGELIFTDRYNNVIKKITLDNKITKFIKTGDWKPISIHSSNINCDILVGMVTLKKNSEVKYNYRC
jgi:streptogramin lyase